LEISESGSSQAKQTVLNFFLQFLKINKNLTQPLECFQGNLAVVPNAGVLWPIVGQSIIKDLKRGELLFVLVV
jgi:hypothetical protein